MKLRAFYIPFSGLKQGKHEFAYSIDNAFFESFDYQEFNDSAIEVVAVLNKMSTMMELEIAASGTVNVNCDVTNEPFDLPLSASLPLVIKFGEEFNDEDDEILILPHGEHQFSIAQYMYEMLVLAVPQKRVHPGVADGSLQSEALDKLETLGLKEENETSEQTDPRWDDLKKLLNDK
ncbi:MAG: DUF177 domain-containing protein [Flavobacteriaceae bacterium]|nr:DUF177 domain-containing protein [Flavobacteriaceae bacterium]